MERARLLKKYGSEDALKKYERDRKRRQRAAKKAKDAAKRLAEAAVDDQKDVIADAPADDLKDATDAVRNVIVEAINERKDDPTVVIKNVIEEKKTVLIRAMDFIDKCDELQEAIVYANKGKTRPPGAKSVARYFKDTIEPLYRWMNNGEKFMCRPEYFDFFDDTKLITSFIENKYPENASGRYLNSRKTRFIALTTVLKSLDGHFKAGDIYSKYGVDYNEKSVVQRSKNLLSDEELKHIIPWKNIIGNEHKLTSDRERLLYALLTYYPRRRNTYAHFRLNHGGAEDNLLILERKRNRNSSSMVLNQYKTFKDYGQFKTDLPQSVTNALVAYVDSADIKDGDLIFKTAQGNEYKSMSSVINNLMYKATGIMRLSTNRLRQSKVTDYYQQGIHSINDDKEHAHQMGHSVATAQQYKKVNLSKDF